VLQFGREELKTLPEFISRHIRELIYHLLAHPQLSIREHAVKAYTLYIARCHFQVVVVVVVVVVVECSPHHIVSGHFVR